MPRRSACGPRRLPLLSFSFSFCTHARWTCSRVNKASQHPASSLAHASSDIDHAPLSELITHSSKFLSLASGIAFLFVWIPFTTSFSLGCHRIEQSGFRAPARRSWSSSSFTSSTSFSPYPSALSEIDPRSLFMPPSLWSPFFLFSGLYLLGTCSVFASSTRSLFWRCLVDGDCLAALC